MADPDSERLIEVVSELEEVIEAHLEDADAFRLLLAALKRVTAHVIEFHAIPAEQEQHLAEFVVGVRQEITEAEVRMEAALSEHLGVEPDELIPTLDKLRLAYEKRRQN